MLSGVFAGQCFLNEYEQKDCDTGSKGVFP